MSDHQRRGIEIPDSRGRTGLDQEGRGLARNPRVRVADVELLSSSWYVLRKTTLQMQLPDGSWTEQHRETYDRGDGAAVLLYDRDRRKVLLVRQFRYPAYVNGHPTGDLLEVPAGLLDADDAESAIRREISEETGVVVGPVIRVYDLFMSPGSVTERIHFFAAAYQAGDYAAQAGAADEGEHTETVELDYDLAVGQIGTEIIDAKTVLLLYWAGATRLFESAAG